MRMLLASTLAVAFVSTAARAADNKAPVITHTPITSVAPGDFVKVMAKITDESKFFPQVFFRYGTSGPYESPLDMKPVKGEPHMFGANIEAKGAVVEYYIEAYDELGNGPGRSGDPDKPLHVRVGAEEPKVSAAPPPAATPSPGPAAAPPPEPSTQWAPAPPKRAPTGAASRAQAAEPKRIWTWAVGGAGLGMLTGGLIAGLAAKTAGDAYNDRLKDPTNNPITLKSQYDAAQGMGSKATLLTITGLVLVAGGVALWFYEPGFYSSGGVSVAAAPVEGGAAVAVASRF
jgi:hypothetical protein